MDIEIQDIVWNAPHAGQLRLDGDRLHFICDNNIDWQLLRAYLPGVENAYATFSFECKIDFNADRYFLYFNLWGGGCAAKIDSLGVVYDLNADVGASVEVESVSHGLLKVTARYFCNHPSISIGVCSKESLACNPSSENSITIYNFSLNSIEYKKILPYNISLLDVGARGGISGPWIKYIGNLDLVLVEPDCDESRKLKKNYPNSHIVPLALSDKKETRKLYITNCPACSSVLMPNFDFLSQYHVSSAFKITSTTEVTLYPYGQVAELRCLPDIDFVKVDVQGFEYEVLSGFGHAMNSILGIELESHLYPVYNDQKLLPDIVNLLDRHGFVLNNLVAQRTFDADFVEVNAWFTKKDTTSLSPLQKEKLNVYRQLFDLISYPAGEIISKQYSNIT